MKRMITTGKRLEILLLAAVMMLGMFTAAPGMALPSGTKGESATNPATNETELADAITNAVSGDTIYIQSMALTNRVTIDETLTIIGVNNAELTISGSGTPRHFYSSANTITLTLSNLTLTGINSGSGGGGVELRGANTALYMNNCTVRNCLRGSGGGGGVYAGSTANLTNCTVTGNTTSVGNGGGVYVIGTADLTGCTVTGNKGNTNGGGYGGGVYAGSTANLTNCTVTGNTVDIGGGVYAGSTSNLTNCTVTGNTAVSTGGGVYANGAVNIRGSIVAGNTAANGKDVYASSSAWSDSAPTNPNYSIIGYCGPAADGKTYDASTIFGANTLQNNGGPTQTIALAVGSPALDVIPAATLTSWGATHDQRGLSRPQGPAGDIGAYEARDISSPLVVTNANDGGIGSLRNAISLANANNGDTITFDQAAFASRQTIILGSRLEITQGLTITGPTAGVELTLGGTQNFRHFYSTSSNITLTLNNLTLKGINSGSGGGGGVEMSGSNGSELYMNNCTVRDCYNSGNGGGVMVSSSGAVLYMTNCTVTGNKAASYGGGVSAVKATLTGCTATGNTASTDGGGVYAGGSGATIRGSIVAGNMANSGGKDVHVYPSEWLDSDGVNADYSIIGYTGTATDGKTYDATTIFGTPAPTVGADGTILIKEGGPAHDVIPASGLIWALPATDQRGVSRPQNTKADIGAVELAFNTLTFAVNPAAGGSVITGTSGNYAAGAVIPIEAAAGSGYVFSGWTAAGGGTFGSAGSASTTFTMPGNATTVTANFTLTAAATDALVNPTTATFDKYAASAGYADVSTTLTPGSYALGSITLGGNPVAATNYMVSGNVYTFKKEFLATIGTGSQTFTFVMSGGTNPTFTVTVSDSTSAPIYNGGGGYWRPVAPKNPETPKIVSPFPARGTVVIKRISIFKLETLKTRLFYINKGDAFTILALANKGRAFRIEKDGREGYIAMKDISAEFGAPLRATALKKAAVYAKLENGKLKRIGYYPKEQILWIHGISGKYFINKQTNATYYLDSTQWELWIPQE